MTLRALAITFTVFLLASMVGDSLKAGLTPMVGDGLQAVPTDQAVPRAGLKTRPYRTSRTPWGDPDLQGNYTNKYEQSTPLERPDEFVGRRVEDITGDELTR